jgi:hypothetical protein
MPLSPAPISSCFSNTSMLAVTSFVSKINVFSIEEKSIIVPNRTQIA